MTSLTERFRRFFIQDEWPLSGDDSHLIRTAFKGTSGQWSCAGRVLEDLEIVLFYSICPALAPEDRRYAIAEFLMRANYGMYIGNFEMDFDDGEIRFKSSVDVEGVESDALFKQLVYMNISTMDRYFPGIMAVLYSNTNPVDALRMIEDSD